ncbi:MAG: hypothetical protein A3J27_13670 [Candidatus Tectomicrobia bacterium RIFCSPLOWO2_12_FULL_69_37]|nr:MAG: hypothetical protein A3J27_13670 [Candidatus Tectomicrobia bacterium RIFCSPLOWO2_12_FULL_69_37]
MKTRLVSGACVLWLMLTAMFFGAPAARGQEDSGLNSEGSRMDSLAASRGEGHVVSKLSGDFEPFLGKDSGRVVASLRNGTPVTLTETVPSQTPGQPPAVKTVTIAPTTGKMGYGNVFISLSLAKQQLAQAGIAQPTASQLQAALSGGSVTNTQDATTQMQGVLTLRSQGMGWGQIAHTMGTHLGSVVSGMKVANRGIEASSAGAVTSPAGDKGAANAGGPGGDAAGAGRSGGKGQGSGEGIVTGGGDAGSPGRGNAFGRGSNGIRGGGRGRSR